jgi:adenylate cyclase
MTASDPGLTDALETLEARLLGARPTLTRVEVAERADVPLEQAIHLWHLLGFADVGDDVPAFTEADVAALRHTRALIDLGVLDQERQDGLIRTWGRSFARLAEWQVALLTDVARELGVTPQDGAAVFGDEVLPRVEELQRFVWQRHLMSAWSRVLVGHEAGPARAVCFVDIVGYTSRSKTMSDRDLVGWLEQFESTALDIVLEHGGQIIKNIGDELLVVVETPTGAAAIALELTRRGEEPDDPFPAVRAGVAYGDVVLRLGDVYGPVVNIAARLTSVARPGTVLVDEGMYAALTGRDDAAASDAADHQHETDGSPYDFRRLRRLSVKGYSRLRAWRLRATG